MSERTGWIRDASWQFWGVVVAMAALLISVLLFWMGLEIKELTVTILAETPLVNVASEAGGLSDLTVLYKGEPATNVVLVQVKVENTGNREIRAEDFATPLRYVFAPDATVVDARVVESVPDNLGMEVAWGGNVATIPALLLNPGDRAVVSFALVYVVASNAGEAALNTQAGNKSFAVDTRIAGVKEVAVIGTLTESGSVWAELLQWIGRFRALFFGGLLVITLLLIFAIRR